MSKPIYRNPKAEAQPCLDDAVFGTTGRAAKDFKYPRLGRCPYDFSSVTFVGRLNREWNVYNGTGLDGGIDGYNWKVRLGTDKQKYVLKVFWDDIATPPHYLAARRECQNAALIESIRAAVQDTTAGPIYVDPRPKTRAAAKANLFAFSNESRAQRAVQGPEPGSAAQTLVTEIPRLRRCHGWMRFTGHELLNRVPNGLLPPLIEIEKQKRRLRRDMNYVGIVYEYVEKGANEPAAVRKVLEFLWLCGFGFAPITKPDNWASGVLLDQSDIVQLRGWGWQEKRFGEVAVEQALEEVMWENN